MSKRRRPKKKRILITNDDGYFTDGIVALMEELGRKNEVYMVAPDREQSASSHSLTLSRPLRVHKMDSRRYATDGTPTDCVMLAIHLLFPDEKPDMIVSGINHGANMGDDITYSGTVAAAIEGSILGIPSLACSMANWEPETPMNPAAKFIAGLVDNFEAFELDTSTFLNVNFPVRKRGTYTRYEFTSLGMRHYKDVVIHKTDPRGKPYYWIGGRPKWKKTQGTDFATVYRNVVSITPIKLNFTDRDSLDRLSQLRLKL